MDINLAPYVRGDDRLSGGANADMDVSLQFGFTNYGEVDAAVKADDSFLVVWREDDGQLYSRYIRVAATQVRNELTVAPQRDVTALVRYEARNIAFDENTNTFEYDLSLVNASDTPLRGPFALRIKHVATTIGPATLKDVHADEIVFVAERSAMLLEGDHTSVVRVRIQVSPEASEKIMAPSTDPRVSIVGRVYAGLPDGQR